MSNTVTTNPIDDYLATAKPAEVEVELCLDRDIRDRHSAANIELSQALARKPFGVTAEAEKEAADALAAERTELAEKVLALEAEMREAATVFLFRNISWTEAQILRAVHPPRDGVKMDSQVGYNWATLPPALIAKCVVSVTFPGQEPTEVTPEQWERFAEVLEPEQVDTLASAVLRMVWRPANPTSALASQTLSRASEAKSKPRATSRSRTSAS